MNIALRVFPPRPFRGLGLAEASIELEREAPALDCAESGYRTALTLAEQLGMRPLQAHCHMELGILYRRKGNLAPAGNAVAAARDLFRPMAMTYWLRDLR